jgi:hypothetical protein
LDVAACGGRRFIRLSMAQQLVELLVGDEHTLGCGQTLRQPPGSTQGQSAPLNQHVQLAQLIAQMSGIILARQA